MECLRVCEPCEDLLLLAMAKLCLAMCKFQQKSLDERLFVDKTVVPITDGDESESCYLCSSIALNSESKYPTLVGLSLQTSKQISPRESAKGCCKIETDNEARTLTMTLSQGATNSATHVARLRASMCWHGS